MWRGFISAKEAKISVRYGNFWPYIRIGLEYSYVILAAVKTYVLFDFSTTLYIKSFKKSLFSIAIHTFIVVSYLYHRIAFSADIFVTPLKS